MSKLFGKLFEKKVTSLDTETEKFIFDKDQPVLKRFQKLSKFTENGEPEEMKKFYGSNYSQVYTLFLDAITQFDNNLKQKNNKFIPTSDIVNLGHILLSLLKYARHVIQKKWQQRSIVHYIETYVDPRNVFTIRKLGLDLLLNFIDVMEDVCDDKVFDLANHVLDFSIFADEKVKLPSFQVRVIDDKDRLKIQVTDKPPTEQEQLQFLSMFFGFIRSNDQQFAFWWKFFKSRIAPILYPHECQSLELLDKMDDMGFRQPFTAPHQIHLLVLGMILECLGTPKKAEVLYSTDKDIYLLLLIFRQSFLLPPQFFEYAQKMLTTYKAWICKDSIEYVWPEIMERSRNIYYRVFIDNLTQTFFMRGKEEYLDIHIAMAYEVLDIFMFFVQIPDKIEFETWSTLLIAHIEIFEHLMLRKSSDQTYDQKFGDMLTNIVVRNLFIIWIKSHPEDEELWAQLLETIKTYYNEPAIAEFWHNTIINLVKSLLSTVFEVPTDLVGKYLTYDIEKYYLEKKKHKMKVTTKKYGASIKEFLIKQDVDVLLHLYHNMTSMYGNDNNNLNGKLHSKKIQTISDSIFLFLNISHQEVKITKGNVSTPFIHAPEGNKLIELYGAWIFEACDRWDTSFLEGKVSAYKTLCRIFCQKFSQPWDKTYLAYYMRAIHNGFGSKNTDIRDVILLNSTEFFSFQYPGSNLLIPDYVKACEEVLKIPKSSKELKLSAISILTSIISICYIYGDIELINIDTVKFEEEEEEEEEEEGKEQEEPEPEVESPFHNFLTIKDKIIKLLIASTLDISTEECQIKSAWGLLILLNKELNEDPSNNMPSKYEIKSIIDTIGSLVVGKQIALAFVSHDIINAICNLGLVPKIGVILASKLLNQIASSMITYMTSGTNIHPDLTIDLYNTIGELIVCVPQETLIDVPVMDNLFTAIAVGLNKDNVVKKIGTEQTHVSRKSTLQKSSDMKAIDAAKEISDASSTLLFYIMNTVNSFPNPNGSSSVSSNLSEFDYFKNIENSKNFRIVHYGFNSSVIMSVMEKKAEDKTCHIVLRDMTGRNCWDYKLVYNHIDQIYQFPEGMEKKKDDGLFKAKPITDSKKDINSSIGSIEAEPKTEETKTEEKMDSETKTEEKTEPGTPIVEEDDDVKVDAPQVEVEGEEEETQKEEVEEEVEEEGEGEEEEEDEDDYPKFDMEIDTDKTDMLEILQNYVGQIFPEYLEFRAKAVTEIEEQVIDTKDEIEKSNEQIALEEELLSTTEDKPFENSRHPEPEKSTHTVFKALRTFLSTLGFVRHGNQQTFIKLTPDQSFYKSLKALDKLPERETYKIGVVYIKNEQEMPSNIFENEKASDLFNEFVDSLGWPVNLKDHIGYCGNVDKSTIGEKDVLPYCATATTEVFFHVTTKITTSLEDDPQNLSKKRLIGNDVVHIIWSEHDRDYRYWTIMAPESFFYIIIYPLKNGFYRVQTVIKERAKIPYFVESNGSDATNPIPIGPLTNGMVVDKISLAPLVKQTALNACKAHKAVSKGFKKPYTTRKMMIDEIITKYRPQKPISYQEFLEPLFEYQEQEENINFVIQEEVEEKSKDSFDPEAYNPELDDKVVEKNETEMEITEM